jgi:hypothetical protein
MQAAPAAKRARMAAVAEPVELKCPITMELLRDPVSNCVGNTYERAAIVTHLAKPGAKRDPLTNVELANTTLVPCQLARRQVQAFLDAHPDYTPEGWPNRMVPPLPMTVEAELRAVAEAKDKKDIAAVLSTLAALPNAAEVQVVGFYALSILMLVGDDALRKLTRDSEAYRLVLGALCSRHLARLLTCAQPLCATTHRLPNCKL